MTAGRGSVMGPSENRRGGMSPADLPGALDGIYEHSPWVAERLDPAELDSGADVVSSLAASMRRIVDGAGEELQLALLRAHPDLAGRLAVGEALTDASADEQASAGLDRCSPEEFEEFRSLNDRYKEKFGFPFILAVRGCSRGEILHIFRRRVENDRDAEFAEALGQVHRIARLRLEERF